MNPSLRSRMNPSLAELAREQEDLRNRLVLHDDFDPERLRAVAGLDVTFLEVRKTRTRGLACLVLCAYPSMEVLESLIVEDEVTFPYIPGFLAYRELPLLLRAYEGARDRAGLYLLDGHGIAHPRGMGVAAHFGVRTGEVSIGCAKTRLYGTYTEPEIVAGAASPLLGRDGRHLGRVMRPKKGKALIFVSPGHRISVETAADVIRTCLKGCRLPEPTRIAHDLLQEGRRARIRH